MLYTESFRSIYMSVLGSSEDPFLLAYHKAHLHPSSLSNVMTLVTLIGLLF